MKASKEFFYNASKRLESNSLPFILFMPAVVCLLLAVAVLSFPSLILSLVVLLLISVASLFLVLAYKALMWKRKFDNLLNQVRPRVIVQPASPEILEALQQEEEVVDVKKIILH